MSRFLTKCDLEIADDTDDGQFILLSALLYQSDIARQVITVPKGFRTDLASVPRLPLVYLLTGDTSREAAVVHDWLYSSHMLTREMSDAVLREASQATGVPGWRRWLMWAGVRVGGGSHWGPDPVKAAADAK